MILRLNSGRLRLTDGLLSVFKAGRLQVLFVEGEGFWKLVNGR